MQKNLMQRNYFMQKYGLVALAAILLSMVVSTQNCRAVDASRSSALTRNAPDAFRPVTNTFNDRSFGNGQTGASALRDRSSVRVAPTWNDPSLPAVDPLRNNSGWSGGYGTGNYGGTGGYGNSGGGNSGGNSGNNNDYGTNVVGQSSQQWRLGIYPEDTDTGVRISEVVRGSAAERAGLERNDRILAVSGYQVGYVEGTLYDTGQEFERHATPQGWVRILVQNGRDGKLLNMPVQLDAKNEAITGTVAYRDRSALPRDAVLNVELREVLSYNSRPVVLARQSYTAARQPISFKLDYDSSQIDRRRNYVLHTNITAGGRQLYSIRQDAPVLGNHPSTGLQLLVESSQGSTFPGGGGPGGGGGVLNRNDQLAQISTWFREYLRREPRSQELYVWEAHLARGGSLTEAQLQILSTPEFYYQSNADDAQYVRRMFQLVTNRQPSQQEISQWLTRLQYHNRLRPEMAREFLAMAKGQARR